MPSKSDGNQSNNKKVGNNLSTKINETLSGQMMGQQSPPFRLRNYHDPSSGLLNNIHSDHHIMDPDGNGSNGSNDEDNNPSAEVVSRIITFGSMPSYRENKIQELMRTTHLKDVVRPKERILETSPEGEIFFLLIFLSFRKFFLLIFLSFKKFFPSRSSFP